MSDATGLTAHAARALLDDSEDAARRAIDVPGAPLFGAWGVFWAGGYGAVWLSVRDQVVYTGPAGWSLAVMGVLGALALAVTAVVIGRATRGVWGPSARAGMFYGLAWPVSFAAGQVVAVGIARAGGGAPELVGVVSATLPALVVAVIYCVSAAVWGGAEFFVAGAALAVAASGGALLGPVDGLLWLLLVGATGFAAAAVMSARTR
ncbi:hypothetical protein JQN72_06320 [Phycicoccus sp. CSK15P-2]|uniref:hypothetical protein n=1 Tax=Phycicoccus sp. CSK15P-2 TaxID=2807627 RepID=UPI001951ED4C|nr:hypothetical protein [Phycicoccus sp. CSK15P-2]MBM6403857.1 hypothetical protein [Phycicoccus sp. CSK15P-2]